MNARRASAIYEGRVTHRRHHPREHAFAYRMAQLYIDLDEVDDVFAGRRFWSTTHRALAEFRRADYLGPTDIPLAEAVRRRVEQATGVRPRGPIRLLTHLRYFGFVFNPVSFYYCFEPGGERLHSIVAEITNTPWNERHAYVLPVATAHAQGDVLRWDFDKTFHVSPFMAMERRYDWFIAPPGDDLRVQMHVLEGATREFDATLYLRRREINGASLARVLLRYPFMTLRVVLAIHWQALRLWLKRTPIHDHPQTAPDAR